MGVCFWESIFKICGLENTLILAIWSPNLSARATNQILRIIMKLIENKKIKTFVYHCNECSYAEEHEMPLK